MQDKASLAPSNIIEKNISWLMSDAVSHPSGGIYGWVNTSNSGFVYDEIASYFIKFLIYMHHVRNNPVYKIKAEKIMDYMRSKLSALPALVKGGNIYAFDSAVFLKSLIMYANAYKSDEFSEYEERLREKIISMLDTKRVVISGPAGEILEDKWSTNYSIHILKVAAVLWQSVKLRPDAGEIKRYVDRICADILDSSGNIPIDEKDIYTHAYCYATEGLISLHKDGYSDFSSAISKAAGYLSEIQNDDGSFFNYPSPDYQDTAIRVSEATAQASRIWMFAGKKEYSGCIDRALSFIMSQTAPPGGVYYSPEKNDINTLATIFAVQAILWNEQEEVPADWLL